MRYHYQKPDIYRSMYGETYICNHPVYNKCTLFRIGDNGLAVIQQRFNAETKSTWWGEVDAYGLRTNKMHCNLSTVNWIDMPKKIERNSIRT